MATYSQIPQNNEDVQLIRLYQQSPTEEIKNKLVRRYTRLVHSLTRRFAREGEQYEDLFQVGMVGLLVALSRFDTKLGHSFRHYAVPTIIGELKRYIRDKTWSVHVPRKVKELGPKINKAVESLTAEYQRAPNIDELASYLNVSAEEILETMEMGQGYQTLSVDTPIDANHEGSLTLLDVVGEQEHGFEKVNQRLLLEECFGVLEEREEAILKLVFLEGLSQKEAGKRLAISQMHVSRLQRKALRKIKESYAYGG